MNRFTSYYMAIKDFIKNGKELQERVYKYRLSLGKDGGRVQAALGAGAQNLIECITLVLQKGISL